MLIRIDPQSDAAIFDQIAASVRADLATGRVAPGDRLPAARDVVALVEKARRLGLSPDTLASLVKETADGR